MSDHEPLKKWNSCENHLQIPVTPKTGITKLHIYDFDNTLYCSPHPNGALYTKVLYNTLFNSSTILNDGGWWSEPTFLEQSFKDMLNSSEKEQATYWSQDIIKLAQASHDDPQTISIVLTGRKEVFFHALFDEMFNSFRDVSFNAICLKRAEMGLSTAEYKISLIEDFMSHYTSLKELIIYDDRLAQVKQFEKVFGRGTVIHVQPRFKMLDIAEESRLVAEIFARSNMTQSLGWTPKVPGFVLNHASHKKLVRRTFLFFRQKYKMSSLPKWPTYIPLKVDSNQEIAKIWSNNDSQTMKSQDGINSICDEFYSQHVLQGTKIFKFDIIRIGYYVSEGNSGNISIFYKAIPSDKSTFVSSSTQNMFVISSAVGMSRNPSRAAGVRWATLDRKITVNATFAHLERLTYTPETQ